MTSPHNGAHGAVHLLTASDALTTSLRRTVGLEATPDGKSLLLIEAAQRKSGTQRKMRYEITPAELIAAIRAHGAELPGESAMARPAESDQIFQNCLCVILRGRNQKRVVQHL